MPESCAASVVQHHLSLMGWPSSAVSRTVVLDRPTAEHVPAVRAAVAERKTIIALIPDASFSSEFGIATCPVEAVPPALFSEPARESNHSQPSGSRRPSSAVRSPSPRLRTLHPWTHLQSGRSEAVLRDQSGGAVWRWLPAEGVGVLFVGTDLANDLTRYRQGDPAAVSGTGQRERWGYSGERPNYLFDAQRAGEPRAARHADEWAWFLANVLATRAGVELDPVLPGGAPGAVVLTGDDDQAALECYREQLELIGDTPITYFLHPLTKHTPETLRTMLGRPGIELGLHPDALDAPEDYEQRLRDQASWFRALAGRAPRALRNHGFLNRGYWGHLGAWLDEGIDVSSNLPGFDGTVLNGSLLPGRLAYDGALTPHWSILTAIGDGVVFVNRWNDKESARCIFDAADAVVSRGIPGVLVLNLHPENVARTEAMHLAALEVIRSGFVAWSMRECLAWFASRDQLASA